MVKSWGLIDNAGTIICGTPDYTVLKQSPGWFVLTFDRPVHRTVVVATARNLKYCDDAPSGMTVCNHQGKPDALGFLFDDPGDHLGFSFMLIDECPVP